MVLKYVSGVAMRPVSWSNDICLSLVSSSRIASNYSLVIPLDTYSYPLKLPLEASFTPNKTPNK